MKSLYFLALLNILHLLVDGNSKEIFERQKKDSWFMDGEKLLRENFEQDVINKKAKGVILFIGDGMGLSTVTAARILEGQLNGMLGEENVLSWETFKNVALSKTYNSDAQTADSAGSATAMVTGVKTRFGVVSINDKVNRKNCSGSKNNEVLSILAMAEIQGLSTGVVTTSRLTHATPASVYAHSADRNWESAARGNCKDIARQFIDFPYGDGMEVAFGGCRKHFLFKNITDPGNNTLFGKREDGRDLTQEWRKKSGGFEFIWNKKQFEALDSKKVEHVLGLFNYDHMSYEYSRPKGDLGEPSLTEMVDMAVKILKKNPKGYFLLVEAARIDHGHHASQPVLALHDTIEMARAVERVKSITKKDETLLIVTADHSHVFTLGGYQRRGTSIFDYTNMDITIAKDGQRFSSLGYVNGPGGLMNSSRKQASREVLKDSNHKWESLIPLNDENHAGEDVGIYARGCQAHLIRGVVEQNYIFHVMDYALCLSENKKKMCESQGNNSSRITNMLALNLILFFLGNMVL